MGAFVTLLTKARIPETMMQIPVRERSMLRSVELSFAIAYRPPKCRGRIYILIRGVKPFMMRMANDIPSG